MSRQINRKSLRLLLTGLLPRVLVPEPPNRRNPRKEGKRDQRFLGFLLDWNHSDFGGGNWQFNINTISAVRVNDKAGNILLKTASVGVDMVIASSWQKSIRVLLYPDNIMPVQPLDSYRLHLQIVGEKLILGQ